MANDTTPLLEDEENGTGFVRNYLLYQLAAASRAASSGFHAIVRERGLRVPEWRVLACLNDRDGQMVTQLADLAMMEQSRLTKIIDQMQDKGFVRRESDASDRRRVRVFLTETGGTLAAELVELARAHEAALIRRLRTLDVDVLKTALQQIDDICGQDADGLGDLLIDDMASKPRRRRQRAPRNGRA